MSTYKVHRSFFDPAGLGDALDEVRMSPAPRWLGRFSLRYWKQANWEEVLRHVPSVVAVLTRRLATLVPDQQFNTLFLQRYEVGDFVAPHRDPVSNVGCTVISVCGDFEGAKSTVAGISFSLAPGDVLVQCCTVSGVQGPWHEVSPVARGVRYAVILNTVQ